LITTPNAVADVIQNLAGFAAQVTAAWLQLRERIVIADDVFTIDKPALFPVNKERPIPLGALATADVLLNLDRGDFGRLLGTPLYGLAIMTLGILLTQQRKPGRPGASCAGTIRPGVCSVQIHASTCDTLRRKLPE